MSFTQHPPIAQTTQTGTEPLAILIVDDEPILRQHLAALIAEYWPEAQITQAEDGIQALALCQQQRFAVAFLDIQMPGLDGLALLKVLRQLNAPPFVVFCTAYNQHAVSAFELEAVDYLLKPLEEPRLQACISRLKQRLTQQQDHKASLLHLQQLLSLVPIAVSPAATAAPSLAPADAAAAAAAAADGELTTKAATEQTSQSEPLRFIKASLRDTVHLLDVADIDYFLAEDKYTTVDCQGQQYLIRTPIAQLEQQLDPQLFWRIHRSTIVQVKSIQKVVRDEFGHMTLHLKNNSTELAVSRACQHLFRQH